MDATAASLTTVARISARKKVLADLAADLIIEPNSRFKCSNHGFALLSLVMEAIVGEPFTPWIKREIVDAVGLKETTPDMPIPEGAPFARGHSAKLLLGERMIGGVEPRALGFGELHRRMALAGERRVFARPVSRG
jgi:CubicO group peptidase (beta-lactamase class C family)